MSDGEHIAKATSVSLGPDDHGIFTCYVELNYGGARQSFGGYDLRGPWCWEFIDRTRQAFGVAKWEGIVGRTVIAVVEGGLIREIKPLPTERGTAFNAREFMAEAVAAR